jgi:hypothetical protein
MTKTSMTSELVDAVSPSETLDKAARLANEILKEKKATALTLCTMITSLVMRTLIEDERFESAVELHSRMLLESPEAVLEEITDVAELTH